MQFFRIAHLFFGTKMWTVQKGESVRSLKWTAARKWTICPKVDGLEPNRTVFGAKVDGHGSK